VAKTVGECEEFWLRCGIPRVVVDEWRSDLETHIAGAIEAGKNPIAVVGSAREWAQEQARDYLKSQSPVDRTLGWAALVLLTSSLVVAPQHVLHATWNFALGWRAIALIVVLVAVTKLLRWSKLTFLVFNPLRRKGLVMFGDYCAFGAGAIVGASKRKGADVVADLVLQGLVHDGRSFRQTDTSKLDLTAGAIA